MLEDEDGRVVTASFKELQKKCKLRHAWARTIHTFQVLSSHIHFGFGLLW